MKWEEVRKVYPDKWVKIQILKSHVEDDTKYIDEIALIDKINDPKEATKQLVNCKDGELVYHTSNEIIQVTIRRRFSPRRRYLLDE